MSFRLETTRTRLYTIMPLRENTYYTKPVHERMLKCIKALEDGDRRLTIPSDRGVKTQKVPTKSSYALRAVMLMNDFILGSTEELVEALLQLRPDVVARLKR